MLRYFLHKPNKVYVYGKSAESDMVKMKKKNESKHLLSIVFFHLRAVKDYVY